MSFRVPTYLRSHRKRWRLAQHELAFLLGFSSQGAISQHETLIRMPEVKVLFKYEALFGESIGNLFPKLRREAETEIVLQAQLLMKRLEEKDDLPAARKLELLTLLVERMSKRGP